MTQGPAVADCPPGARMRPRVLDDHEFVWMLRGQAGLVVEGAERPLSPGRLLLVPPDLRHGFVWDRRQASRHGYVHFRVERENSRDAEYARVRPMTERDPLGGLCAYLIWLGSERPEAWERDVTRTLGLLLALFRAAPMPGDRVRTARPASLTAAVDHLRREWSQMPLRPIDLDELAAASHVSRSYLSRLFRTEFGLSTASALERLRCFRAETLLTRTDMTAGSVGHACGFADLAHFSHRFSRLYEMPPSRYRELGGSAPSMLDHAGVRRLASDVWE